jgi:hypothetical protein
MGWSLVRAPERIHLAELIQLYLLDAKLLPKQSDDADIRAWFASMEKCLAEPGGLTLCDIWSK